MVLDDYSASINVLLRKAHILSVYDRVATLKLGMPAVV